MPPRFSERFVGHLVAVKVMVAVAAECKMMIDAEVLELDAGAVANVARQQSQSHARVGGEPFKKMLNAGQDRTIVPGETSRQPAQITVAQPLPVGGIVREAVHLEQVADDGPVGAAAVGHAAA